MILKPVQKLLSCLLAQLRPADPLLNFEINTARLAVNRIDLWERKLRILLMQALDVRLMMLRIELPLLEGVGIGVQSGSVARSTVFGAAHTSNDEDEP